MDESVKSGKTSRNSTSLLFDLVSLHQSISTTTHIYSDGTGGHPVDRVDLVGIQIMSVHLDYAEISRHARMPHQLSCAVILADPFGSVGRIVDANRARSVLQQTVSVNLYTYPQCCTRPLQIVWTMGRSTDFILSLRLLALVSLQNTGNPERPRKRVKFRRTTTGCLSCRQHKVKCDETLPACLRCVAAQRICEYPAARASDGVKRRKRRKSKEDRGVHEEGSERGDRKESGRLVGEGVKGAGGPSTPSRGVSTAVKKLDGKANDGMKFDLSPSEVFNIPLSSSSPSPTPKAPPPPPSDLAFLNDFIPNLKTNFPPTLPNSPHGNNRHPPTNQPDATFLQLPDLHKSVLLSRRVRGKDKGPSPIVPSLSTTTSSSILPRIATIDGLLQ